MKPTLPGLHHVTAITGDAQKNVDFYCGTLGLRLIKLTVNFDDPGSYHLYYGDELGRPGTAMTFFAWNGSQRGRVGPPQAIATAFAVPEGALPYWRDRLAEQGVSDVEEETRFEESVLSFCDPDQMRIELIATSRLGSPLSTGGAIPVEHAMRGFHSVTLASVQPDRTAALLTGPMAFQQEAEAGPRTRYRASGGEAGVHVDLLHSPDAPDGSMGTGVVHHVAFRVPDDEQQEAWLHLLKDKGFDVSPVMDRTYFHSIYFREPAGFLFEIATEGPGFTADETSEALGSSLKLPPWMEPHRAGLIKNLPEITLPSWP